MTLSNSIKESLRKDKMELEEMLDRLENKIKSIKKYLKEIEEILK